MDLPIINGRQKINRAIQVFTNAQDMLGNAIEVKKNEIQGVSNKIIKLEHTNAEHNQDLEKAERVLDKINKILE